MTDLGREAANLIESSMSRWQPYPLYKKSAISWLQEAPASWTQTRIKYISTLKGRLGWQGLRADEYTDSGPYVVSSEQFYNHTILWEKCPHVSAERYEQDTNIQLAINDVLLMKDGAAMGKLAYISDLPYLACLNSHLLLFRPRGNMQQAYIPRYMFYVLASMPFQHYLKVYGTGSTFLGISQQAIGDFELWLPSIFEQNAIFTFLDRETAEIDALIAKKRELIVLLHEQRSAMISHAVTKGLNPDAAMKGSGIEWLGDIPAHWTTTRSKRLFSVRDERAKDGDQQLSATQAYGVIPQEEFEQRVGRQVVKIFKNLEQRSHVEKDDFVISMRSFQGGLERAWVRGCIRSSYVVLKPNLPVDVDFFTYLFKSSSYIQALQATADFIRDGQDLTFRNFSLVDLPIVPIDEQRVIAEYLSKTTREINQLIEKTSETIVRLQEYRTALISAAVAGKIDVREYHSRE